MSTSCTYDPHNVDPDCRHRYTRNALDEDAVTRHSCTLAS